MKKDQQEQLLKVVRDNYREIATQFDATRKKYLWPELQKILNSLKDNCRLLDVGCGNGRLIENLKNKKISYLGVDSSEELIKLAITNYPGYSFKVGDILKLTAITEQRFDLVISVAVLHHLPSKELRLEALKQLKTMVASDGQIVFSVWKLWSNKKYQKYLWRSFFKKITLRSQLDFGDILFPWKNDKGEPVSERYYHVFTKRSLKNLVKTAGFKNFKLYDDHYNYWVIIKE